MAATNWNYVEEWSKWVYSDIILAFICSFPKLSTIILKDARLLIALNDKLSCNHRLISYAEPQGNCPLTSFTILYISNMFLERAALKLLKLARMDTNNLEAHFTHWMCVVGKCWKSPRKQISFSAWKAMLQQLLCLSCSLSAHFWEKYLVKQSLLCKIWSLTVGISGKFWSCFLTEAELCYFLQDRNFTALNCQTFSSRRID